MAIHVIDEARRCLNCKKPMCRTGCPINTPIPDMIHTFINGGINDAGQMLFDAHDPCRLIDRLDKPFFYPETAFEKSGQYKDGTVFIEGLAYFKQKFFLYYGCADSRVGVATSPAK